MTRRPARLLHRTLGLTEVTVGGVGIIIGAGIYVLLGAATALAGPVVWLAFLLAAVLSLLPIQGLGSVAVMMSQLPRRAIVLGTAFCVLGLATGWLLRFRVSRDDATLMIATLEFLCAVGTTPRCPSSAPGAGR